MQAYVNRHDLISTALAELNKYPGGSKRPSVNSIVNDFGLLEATLRHAIKN
ncbi:26730_t:CDS:1, partial [Gigaspora margarita]